MCKSSKSSLTEVMEESSPSERCVSVAVQSVLICKERIFFACCVITTAKQYPVIASLMLAILCGSIVCALHLILSRGCTKNWHIC